MPARLATINGFLENVPGSSSIHPRKSNRHICNESDCRSAYTGLAPWVDAPKVDLYPHRVPAMIANVPGFNTALDKSLSLREASVNMARVRHTELLGGDPTNKLGMVRGSVPISRRRFDTPTFP